MGMEQATRAQGVEQQGDQIGALIQSLDKRSWQTSFQANPNKDIVLNEGIGRGAGDPNLPTVVVVDMTEHKTHLLQMHHGELTEVLTVPNSTGKAATPTPEQRWEVSDMRLDPIWYPPKSIGGDPVRPYKETHKNPIGLAFIRLDGTNFGMHGTNRPDQIGKSVSHGCMRHLNEDIMKIYPLVDEGTPVYTVKKFAGTRISTNDFRANH